MRAVFQERYGSPEEVLRVRDLPVPAVGEREVLVRVRAASVHPDVWHVVTGRPWVLRLMGSGLRRPRNPVPGTDAAGVVEAVGRSAARFAPGDEVFGETHAGFQWKNGGAFAEYAAVPEDALARKPKNVTFEQAASVPTSGYIAILNLQFGGGVRPGQRVLVNGAAGGVGSVALQVAKARGASVTGVDGPGKLALLRGLGADRVVDYAREDVTRGAERFDLVIDVASNLSLAAARRVLTAKGVYVLIGHDHFGRATGRVLGSLPRGLSHLALAPFVRHLPRPGLKTPPKGEVMAELAGMLEAGTLTPVVDSTFPLESVTDAMRRMQGGGAAGRILITP